MDAREAARQDWEISGRIRTVQRLLSDERTAEQQRTREIGNVTAAAATQEADATCDSLATAPAARRRRHPSVPRPTTSVIFRELACPAEDQPGSQTKVTTRLRYASAPVSPPPSPLSAAPAPDR